MAEKGREQEVIGIFEKWDLHAEPIGVVTAVQPVHLSRIGRDIVDGVRALAAGRTHFGSTNTPPADDL